MSHRVMVKPHPQSAELVSIRYMRKGAKPHFMGAVSLSRVTATVEGLEADFLEEWSETRELDSRVLKHFTALVHTHRGFVKLPAWTAYLDALDAWIEAEEEGPEPEFPQTVTGNTYRAAYVCGSEFYVA